MKKFLIYIALFFSAATLDAQIINPQTGFLFYNTGTFSVDNYSAFTMPYTLPVQQEGYSQLNDSNCSNVPVIFSTNGINVYNGATGVVVASGLLGESNSTNAATIVPIFNNRALIITTKAFSSTTNEAYSSILTYTGSCSVGYTFTMPVITKNIQLTSFTGITSIAEKVTVLRVPGSNDYWLLMHEATNAGGGSGKFLVFRISYTTGTISAVNDYTVGLPVRKIGGKGQMQAIASQDPALGPIYLVGAAYFIKPTSMGGAVDVLIMNPSTGALSLKETITASYGWNRPYGLEFSRSGSLLYVASRNVNRTMMRYDASVAPGTIVTTAIPSAYSFIGSPIPNFRFGQLQRTENDAIYAPLFGSNRLMYIPVSSLPASFPAAPPATTISGVNPFRFGLPNYWRN
jgi:hypothetical protein